MDHSYAYRLGKTRKIQKSSDFELTHKRASELAEFTHFPKVESDELKTSWSDSKFTIAIMNRSANYFKANEKSEIYTYRNFEFENFHQTIKSNKDINFVRLGVHSTSQKISHFSQGESNLIEYGELLRVNPRIDFAIMTKVDAYFGADTGPLWFFLLRSIPTAVVNEIPIMQEASNNPYETLVIPKLLWDMSEKRLLTLHEMVSPLIANLRFTKDYQSHRLEAIDNSEEEIAMFFQEWRTICIDRFEEYDEERMNWIRNKVKFNNLPSIGMKFLERYQNELRI
jgi:putative glycosyltransferase (TIGR04372 family)